MPQLLSPIIALRQCSTPTFIAQAIIYVVDSSDKERIGISREEFQNLLTEDELSESVILVYANKQVLCLTEFWNTPRLTQNN